MPYKVVGSDLMHLKGGLWSVKQRCKSHKNAVSAMRLLQMKEHGVEPEGGWRDKMPGLRKNRMNVG